MSPRIRAIGPCLGLCAAVFAVFGQVAGHEFFDYDLRPYLTEHAWVRRGFTWDGLRTALTSFDAANWHPVTWVSYMLEIEVLGLRPGPMHLGNVALHAANACLVFVVLRELTGRAGRSFLVALLFALHPQRVQAVAWIVERKGLLCALFGLLALHFWIGWTRERRPWTYASALVCFAACVMSKAMLVTWPFVMLLLDVWPLDRVRIGLGRRLVEKLPFFALSIVACVLTYLAEGAGGALRTADQFPIDTRLANAILSYVAYLGKTFWPAGLSFHYMHLGAEYSSTNLVLAGLLLAAITFLAIRLRRRAPWILIGWLWFLGTLVPVIGIVQVGSHSTADRFTYLPFLGVAIAVVWSAGSLLDARPKLAPVAIGLAAAVCVALASLSWRETGFWKDTETLCEHVLAVDSDNDVVHNLFGAWLVNQGRAEEAIPHLQEVVRRSSGYSDAQLNLAIALGVVGRTDEAERLLRDVQRRAGESATLHTELSRILLRGGRTPEALEETEKALAVDPRDPRALLAHASVLARLRRTEESNAAVERAVALVPDEGFVLASLAKALQRDGFLVQAEAAARRACELEPEAAEYRRTHGQILESLERPVEARRAYERALEIDPKNVYARLSLARLLVRAEDLDGAEHELRRAIAETPAEPEAHRGLALVLIARGKLAEALPVAREALRLRPDWSLAMGDLAWILARVDDLASRDPQEAVRLGEAAAQASGRRHPGILDSLAAAYAARGDIPKAAATAEAALQLAIDQRDDAFATRVARRLLAYRAGTIDRETMR